MDGQFKLAPPGKIQIGKCLPKAAQEAVYRRCGKKIANNSFRETSISWLLDGGTPENFVPQLSEHKYLQSLSYYKSASITHRRKMWTSYNNKPLDRVQVQMHQTLSLLMNQARSSLHLPNEEASASEPHPSLFASANKGSISNCVFNLVQSAPSNPSGSLHQCHVTPQNTKNWILLVEKFSS